MKIFDFKNPKHIQILKEEIKRAKDIIKNVISESSSYNEDEIWKSMTEDERYDVISAVADDEGPDLADRYVDEVWDNIPDDITDQINLSPYRLAKNDRTMGEVMLRGISGMKWEFRTDPEKASAFEKLIDGFCKKIRKTYDQLNVRDAIELNQLVAKLKNKFSSVPQMNARGNAGEDYGKGSRNWTGD